ncbi:MAG: iron-sulfur cluster assembly accessory protein [Gammaproteobacteria bacterium]|nr:iron-sulfur cluster assembly accessory protein [Gammaproteobacteria bacterium]MDH5801797.1 iron-sulfur cluster assembly accessory protein [Gammaproteobacteria bacterium]
MITISPEAAAQIRLSAERTASESLPMRIAAKVAVDESIEYGLGFDEKNDDDLSFTVEGINIIIAKSSAELLHGAHLHFVDLEDGTQNFIFQNPNDPNYKPPKED